MIVENEKYIIEEFENLQGEFFGYECTSKYSALCKIYKKFTSILADVLMSFYFICFQPLEIDLDRFSTKPYFDEYLNQ